MGIDKIGTLIRQYAGRYSSKFIRTKARIIDKIAYKPSLRKLEKCATSVEDLGNHKRLFLKGCSSNPLIFKGNQSIEEINRILQDHHIGMGGYELHNLQTAFETLPALKGRSIRAFLGRGGSSRAFLLDNNMVLKQTRTDFVDKAVTARNVRSAFDETLEAITSQIGDVGSRAYSLQEFGIPNVRYRGFLRLTRDLNARGAARDMDWHFGQCARFRDNRPTLWGKINPFGLTKVVDLGCIHPPVRNA